MNFDLAYSKELPGTKDTEPHTDPLMVEVIEGEFRKVEDAEN